MNTITIQNPIVKLRFDNNLNQILDWIITASNIISKKPIVKASVINRILRKINLTPPKEHQLEACILDELWTLLHDRYSQLCVDSTDEAREKLLDEYRKHIDNWDRCLAPENGILVEVMRSNLPRTYRQPGVPAQRTYHGVFNLI